MNNYSFSVSEENGPIEINIKKYKDTIKVGDTVRSRLYDGDHKVLNIKKEEVMLRLIDKDGNLFEHYVPAKDFYKVK